MKFKLIEIPYLSGRRCKVYSVLIDGEEKTLFEKFTEENEDFFPEEIDAIFQDLADIGQNIGARDHYFRSKKEGILGDGVEALFDRPHANLRVYAVRYGSVLLVLGGGGYKSKEIRAFQEDPKLTKENYLMRQIANTLYKAIRSKDLRWNRKGDNFEAPFYFDSEDY